MSQPELPLEWPVTATWKIEVRKGPLHGEESVRSVTATSPEDALDMIDAQREYYAQRENVRWDGEEVDKQGRLYGLGPPRQGGRESWVLTVVPPLG